MELTDAQEAELLADLAALKVELEQTLAQTASHTDTVELDQAAVGRISRVDALQAQKMAEAQKQRSELRLKQVIVALNTAAEGDYGVCKLCGDDIGYGRLKARPESPACVSCMRDVERGA